MKPLPAIVVSFRLRPDQRKRLREIARRRNVKISELYRRALDEIILRDGEITKGLP